MLLTLLFYFFFCSILYPISLEQKVNYRIVPILSMNWTDLVLIFWFKSIATLEGYLMLKLDLLKNSSVTIKPEAWRDKKVHAFSISIRPSGLL